MAKFTIETIVYLDVEAKDLNAAIDWCCEHTVFDMLDRGTTGAYTIKDPKTQDILAEDI